MNPIKLLTFIRTVAFFIIGYGVINTSIILLSFQFYAPTQTGIFFRYGMTLPAGLFTSFNAFGLIMICGILRKVLTGR